VKARPSSRYYKSQEIVTNENQNVFIPQLEKSSEKSKGNNAARIIEAPKNEENQTEKT